MSNKFWVFYKIRINQAICLIDFLLRWDNKIYTAAGVIPSILNKNKEINLISSTTEKSINTRHIVDSAQTIDFINKNEIKICTDLGSGAGLPGIVLAILMKPKKPEFKVIFYEKSYHKSNFLKEISKKFKLNTEIKQKNIFEQKNLQTDIII